MGMTTDAKPRRSVLVVDDDPDIRSFIAKLLEGAGLETTEAGDAIEAFQWLGTHRPDLVITDLSMPFVDGLDLVRWIKSNFTLLPVIICSPRADSQSIQDGFEFGADDYIVAPF